MTFQFSCPTIEDTQAVAAVIGAALKGGEVIEFKSDLGGGKTTFVKGLARGMGVTDVVQSPTFIISSLHNGARGLELHHFDFYRLDNPGVMSAELAESLQQKNAVVVVEWGDIVHDVLPAARATVGLSVPKDETRVITIDLPDLYPHIAEALNKYKQQGNIA
jgi:tRNA threonylcarbamoyladenosine biosynthesis protein TsaE